MAWSDDFRVASFQSLLAAPRVRVYRTSGGEDSPLRAQARVLLLDAMLWLEFGVRIGYWREPTAALALPELTPAFEGIYDWLRASGQSLPEGPVDDVLRIKDEGLVASNRRLELSGEAASAAGMHLRNAMTFVGRYTGCRQGAFSQLVAELMFGSTDQWSVVLDRIDVESSQKDVGEDGPIADAIGVLRYMEGALTIANAAARDSRLNVLESQRVSNELLGLMAWSFNLGDRTTRTRFKEFFSRMVAAMREEIDISGVEQRLRDEIASLADTWEAIAHQAAAWKTVRR